MKTLDDYLYIVQFDLLPSQGMRHGSPVNFFIRDTNTGECFPFNVANVEGVGRVLRASINLGPGDIIFKELPVVVGHICTFPINCQNFHF